jgi:methionyl-tRNA formyltransferase
MRIAIIGRSELLYDSAEHLALSGHEIALVVTAKEAPEYRRTAADFEALAVRHGAVFIRSTRLDQQVPRIRALEAIDIGVSVNHPGIISQHAIDAFRLGILNAHAGDLPRFRGNATLAWAIIAGEPRMGLCVHRMVGGELDTGDIVARKYRVMNLRTTVGELWDWMGVQVPHLFAQALDALGRDSAYVLERQSENPVDALRCYPRRPEDGRIMWGRSAEEVIRLINASGRPYGGAFFDYRGERVAIVEAELIADQENFLAIPGQVTAIGDHWVQVATGRGKIQLNRVRRGSDELPASALVRSIRERFG